MTEESVQEVAQTTQTAQELFTPKNEREQLEELLKNPNVSEQRKRNVRTYIEASDYLKENESIGDIIMSDKRMGDESYSEYKDRQRLSKEITRQYLQGRVLDNPGGGTYVKEIDGEVGSTVKF